MPAAYSVYWPSEAARAAARVDPSIGFRVVFGGPHQSQPSFRGAGVQAEDELFFISITKGRVALLGTAVVDGIEDVADALPREFVAGSDVASARRDWLVISGWPVDAYYAALCRTCTTEAVTLSSSNGPMRERFASPDVVRDWLFLNRRGPRRPKGVETGQVHSALAFRGIYRLAPRTSAALVELAVEPPRGSPFGVGLFGPTFS